MRRAVTAALAGLLVSAVGPPAAATDPEGRTSNNWVGAVARNGHDHREEKDPTPVREHPQIDPIDLPHNIAPQPQVVNASKRDIVKVKTEVCSDMSLQQCVNGRTACMTDAGGGDGFLPPIITWTSTNGGAWTYRGLSCGNPQTVTVPGEPGEPDQVIEVEAPPIPTLGEIQTAFKRLPFSKPSISVEPKGMKTLKNLKTFYAADWPDNSGLQPGEISKPVKLLSWTIEFKVAAQDYRYDFGDGSTSEWTSSTGGSYPEGDVTHTYKDTGDMDTKVDARLTGQYRVNGGPWQNIATTADLQDEPVDTLQVLGTKTRLVTDRG